MKRSLSNLLLTVIIVFSVSSSVCAAGTLIPISSTTFDSSNTDKADGGIAFDSDGNIIVLCSNNGGGTPWRYMILKYNSDFSTLIASTTYDSGNSDLPQGVAVNSNDDIIVTGSINTDIRTLMYPSDLSGVPVTKIFTSTVVTAAGIALDSNDNIYVTGQVNNAGDNDFFTIKYSSALTTVISSHTYKQANDIMSGIAIDNSNNVFVCGYTDTPDDYRIVKYDSDLVFQSSAAYSTGDVEISGDIALDSEGNVIITGYTSSVNDDYLTVKYSPDLASVLAAVTYNDAANQNDQASDVAVDNQDNIIVAGDRYIGGSKSACVIRYNSDLSVAISSHIFNTGGGDNQAMLVETDSDGNIIMAGIENNGNDDILLIKYLGPPEIASITPGTANPGDTINITVTGERFHTGITAVMSGTGVTLNSVSYVSPTQLTLNVTVQSSATAGKRDIIVTNTDGANDTGTQIFEVVIPDEEEDDTQDLQVAAGEAKVMGGSKGYVNPVAGEKAKIYFNPESAGKVTVKVYTRKGQLVWEDTKTTAGTTDYIEWACRNAENNVVASGIYIVYIDGPGINTTRKIAIVK